MCCWALLKCPQAIPSSVSSSSYLHFLPTSLSRLPKGSAYFLVSPSCLSPLHTAPPTLHIWSCPPFASVLFWSHLWVLAPATSSGFVSLHPYFPLIFTFSLMGLNPNWNTNIIFIVKTNMNNTVQSCGKTTRYAHRHSWWLGGPGLFRPDRRLSLRSAARSLSLGRHSQSLCLYACTDIGQ